MDNNSPIFALINIVYPSYLHQIYKNFYVKNKLSNDELFSEENIIVLFKGEIYNNINICEINNYSFTNNCELIFFLYKKYGIDELLRIIDGEFILMIIDIDYGQNYSNLYVTQDCYGKSKLYTMKYKNNVIGISNNYDEIMREFRIETNNLLNENTKEEDLIDDYVSYIPNGTYDHYRLSYKVMSNWEFYQNKSYYCIPLPIFNYTFEKNIDVKGIQFYLQNYLYTSIYNNLFSIKNNNGVINYDNIVCKINYNTSILYALKKILCKEYNVVSYKYKEIEEDSYIYRKKNKNISEIIKLDTTMHSTLSIYNDMKSMDDSENKILFTDDGFYEIFGDACSHITDPIEFDKQTRENINTFFKENELENTSKIKYPYFDRELIQYYLSIPLMLRFKYRTNSFLMLYTYKKE